MYTMRLFIMIIFGLFSVSIFAQQPLKHEKKVFVNQDGKYFINQKLPIYITMTVSDAPNAKKYPLKSEKTPEAANPFLFMNEGHNPIRVTSAQTQSGSKVPVYLDVYVDGTPPNTKLKFDGAKEYKAFNASIYGTGLTITLTADDELSQVEGIYYSLNKAKYVKYEKPLTFTKDGEFTLKYYSVDNVGNVEASSYTEFKVDVTPPVTKYGFEGPKHENTLSADTKIMLSKDDNMAGIFKAMYSFDGGDFRNYTGSISCKPLKDGKHTIVFYSIDNAGNMEDSKKPSNKYEFYVDRNAPELEMLVEGDKYTSPGKTLFISGKTKIKLNTKDNHSGIEKVTYEIKGSDPQISVNPVPPTPYSAPFVLPEKGPQVIIATAVDKIGNTRKKSLKLYMDNVPPKTGIKYGRPQYFDSESSLLCITSKTYISFFTTMYHSGVLKTTYKIDDGPETEYKSPIKIPKEGKHKIIYRSYDNVGNVENEQRSFVQVDNTPPEVSIRFPSEGKTITMSGKSLKSYPSKSRMYLDAKDNISGVKSVYFSINGGPKKDYNEISSAVMEELFEKPYVYKIIVEVSDKLNNIKPHVFEFAIVDKK